MVQVLYLPNFVNNRYCLVLFVLFGLVWLGSHLHLSFVICAVAVFNEVIVSVCDLTKIDMQ